MFTLPSVLGMLISMSVSNYITNQIAITAATTQAATQAGVAGAIGGMAASRPGLFANILLAPLRVAYFPIYVLSGQRKLDLVYKRTEAAFTEYINELTKPWLSFGDAQISASETYIEKLKQAHENFPTQPLPQIELPSFGLLNLKTLDNQQYTAIILDENVQRTVIVVMSIISGYLVYRILVIAFRVSIRYTIQTIKEIKSIIQEENQNLEQAQLERSYKFNIKK